MASITSWQWEIDGVVVSTSQNYTTGALSAGTHEVTLTVVDDAGDSASRTWVWEIHAAARSVATWLWTIGDDAHTGQVVGKTLLDAGFYTVGLRVTDSAGAESYRSIPYLIKVSGDQVTFSWNFGDGTAITTGRIVQHTYFWGGNFTVTLTATDFYGRQYVLQATVEILVYGVAITVTPLNGRAPLSARLSPRLFLTGVDG